MSEQKTVKIDSQEEIGTRQLKKYPKHIFWFRLKETKKKQQTKNIQNILNTDDTEPSSI
jgi:hypothetical protein